MKKMIIATALALGALFLGAGMLWAQASGAAQAGVAAAVQGEVKITTAGSPARTL